MKYPAFILIILMLFFTAQPLLVNCQLQHKKTAPEMTGCCGGKSCHKKEKDQKTESKDCDGTNACNPFAGCSGCQYVAVSKFFYSSVNIQSPLTKAITESENIEAGFINNCFHPPEQIFI